MDIQIVLSLTVVVAVVIGIVQAAKTMGLPTQFAPLLAIVLGIIMSLGLSLFEATFSVIMTGLIIGLSACGLYSGVKTTAGQ